MMRMFLQRSGGGGSAGSLALGPWHIHVRVMNV